MSLTDVEGNEVPIDNGVDAIIVALCRGIVGKKDKATTVVAALKERSVEVYVIGPAHGVIFFPEHRLWGEYEVVNGVMKMVTEKTIPAMREASILKTKDVDAVYKANLIRASSYRDTDTEYWGVLDDSVLTALGY